MAFERHVRVGIQDSLLRQCRPAPPSGRLKRLGLSRFHQFESFFLPMSFIICIMSSDLSLKLYQAMAVAEFGRAVDAGCGRRPNVARWLPSTPASRSGLTGNYKRPPGRDSNLLYIHKLRSDSSAVCTSPRAPMLPLRRCSAHPRRTVRQQRSRQCFLVSFSPRSCIMESSS